ncbi:hypothetical protein AB0M46_15250 [Dactylosporangium sp. NPDC051485]|uniref:hypothetical protein n=1 Tax=Dactylosporangium sp. NPDC051485 TaxID=3154846 RepID=UPI00343F8B86
MRRLLSVVILAALAGTSAACSQSDDKPASASSTASSPSPSASPSPTVDVKANTKQVCDKAKTILTPDAAKPIGTQIGLMIQARQSGNKAAEQQAMAKAKELADGLAQQARDLKAEVADAKLRTALDKAADGIALFGSPDYLKNINSIDDMTKLTTAISAAVRDLETACNP